MLTRLVTNSPAWARSAVASASCAVARPVLTRDVERVSARRPGCQPLPAATRRSMCIAGHSPKSTLVPRVSESVNSRIVRLSSNGSRAASSAGNVVRMAATAERAMTSAAAPPRRPTSSASVISSRIRRRAPAPIQRRTAISPLRSAARASIRLARLAHAMSRTRPVTDSSKERTSFVSSRLTSRPRAPPSSTIRRARNSARARSPRPRR